MGSCSQIRRRRLTAVIAVAFLVFGTQSWAGCSENRVDLRGAWGTASFSVEVADDVAERAQGLMHRESLPQSAGMLFAYDRSQYVAFWMRNTLIPLDMIFMDDTGRVTRVHENAVPLDETGIEGGDDIKFVLEINGGLSRQLGIAEGSELRHPVVGASAAWACD